MKKPRIKILGTGGTLASVASTSISNDYATAAIPVETLLRDIPVADTAIISSEQVSQINSENMTEEIWLKLANRVQYWVEQDEVDGIVITHGTDTMEETAYFLNLVIQTKKPIVLTGAMRPANAISADGLKNLYNAIVLAADSQAYGQGVLVTLNDVIHHAREVSKNNVSTLNAFESPELGILGYITENKVYLYRTSTKIHTFDSEFSIKAFTKLPIVHIIFAYVGSSPKMVEACIAAGAKGIIATGMGKGYQSQIVNKALQKVRSEGVTVVRCSRARNGIILRESMDDKYGYVVSNMLTPQKARILLALALTKTHQAEHIQEYFMRY